ncbi:DNA repair protein rad16 [Tulasnella sp. 332]|nr:DNA repair protein rad16 [Tulasnella sp. 332]
MPRTRSKAVSISSDDLDGERDTKKTTTSSNFAGRTRGTKSGSTTANSTSSARAEDEDEDYLSGDSPKSVPALKVQTARMMVSAKSTPKDKGKKRAMSDISMVGDDSDRDEMLLMAPPPERTSKRRMIKREVFVEIVSKQELVERASSGDLKGKGKATTNGLTTPLSRRSSAKTTPSSLASRFSTRSKVTASSSGVATPAVDFSSDGELVDDPDELEFDEDAESGEDDGSVFETSDESDSDFEEVNISFVPRKGRAREAHVAAMSNSAAEPSDEEVPLAHAMAADDEEEAEMLKEAIMRSKKSDVVANKGGFYDSEEERRNTRAQAAERRLAKRQTSAFDVNDEESSALSSVSDNSGSEGGGFIKNKRGKGKGKASAKQTVKEKKLTKKQQRAAMAMEKNPVYVLCRAEKKKLGRPLTWAEKTAIKLQLHHPELKDVWGNLERLVKPISPQRAEQPEDLKAQLLPFQQESLYWMRKQEEESVWKGGCLADEMGMGKTIQTLALLSSDRQKPNLIVAPTVAIMQWRNEIELHTTGFKVMIFHGGSREKDPKVLGSCDVVLTTYAVMESTFRRQESGFQKKNVIMTEKSVLHEIEWARVVLDEAHNIKERATNTAKAAFELKAKYRWCLSGTPLQNRVGELYSLVRFLGGDPFSYYFCKDCDCKSLHWSFKDKRHCDADGTTFLQVCKHSPMQHTCFWNNEILTPIQKHAMTGPGQTAFKKLKILLDRMMLRRTKLERADDLGLPPRTVIVRRDYFSVEEKELYLSLFSDAKRQFSTYAEAGTLLNNYSNIFSLITRMRQMACHPDLVLKSKTNASFSQDVVEATVCRICNDIAEDSIQSKCRHIFDRECIKQYLSTAVEDDPTCPVCHVALSIDLEAPALELDEAVVNKARQGILGRIEHDGWRSSSKIEALVEELSNLRREDRTTKSIVFSQFVNFLDLIAWRLQRAGFVICRLEGTMSPQARDATIKHFMNNVEVTVFLVSLKAGGVALNLVEASRVYLMDSWWNPAVEYQAMDRIHRLGQHRPVQAIKLVIEDSIESRIVQLQEKKTAMVDATLSTDDSAMGRLTPEDLGFLFRL